MFVIPYNTTNCTPLNQSAFFIYSYTAFGKAPAAFGAERVFNYGPLPTGAWKAGT
jgi:hypothetical protein